MLVKSQGTSLPQRPRLRRLWNVVLCLCALQVWSIFSLLAVHYRTLLFPTTFTTTNNNNNSPTCRVAITNSQPFHFETLESIGALLPASFLQAAATHRACSAWIFDLHLPDRPTPRFDPWAWYFKQRVLEQQQAMNDDDDDNNNNRTWGRLVLYKKKSTWTNIPRLVADYDVTVEASCYCDAERGLNQLANNARHVCIFHQACGQAARSSLFANRSVWLSPHHRPQYYLPTALPVVANSWDTRRRKTPLQLCVTGNSRRRQWSLLEPSLQQQQQQRQHDDTSPPFEIRIYSDGELPAQLQPYTNQLHLVNTHDYVEFHENIASNCHALVFLVTRTGNSNYFAGGLQKLTGSMPLVVAYRLPYVVHQELYDLYRDDLPIRDETTIPFATHADDVVNFTTALAEFLPRLRDYYYYGDGKGD